MGGEYSNDERELYKCLDESNCLIRKREDPTTVAARLTRLPTSTQTLYLSKVD